MAFPVAGGYTNLPNGNFSPVIYSKKAQSAFRKTAVASAVTNTDYFGEIANYGDSVKIIKEPNVTVAPYKRGTVLTTQDLTDADFTMIIDQANAFQFQLDDIEVSHSHINWIDLAADEAAYTLRDTYDREVIGYMAGWEFDGTDWARRTTVSGTKADAAAGNDELFAAHQLNITHFGGADLGVDAEVTSIPVDANGGTNGVTSPLAIINRFARLMDQKNVPTEDRYVVIDPVFQELLMDENSKLINSDWGGEGELRNGRLPGMLRGFKVYKSNNLPFLGTGAGTTAAAGSETNFGVIVAGHKGAVATAEQIEKVERFRAPDTFAERVRGLHLYGRKILRPESLTVAYYNVA